MKKKVLPTGTLCDVVTSKKIFINKKKVGWIRSISFEYDINKGITLVHLIGPVKRSSVKIDKDDISFETVNYKGGNENEDKIGI